MPFPAASLMKLPLAMAIYEQAVSGKLSLDERIRHEELGRTAYPSIFEVFSHDHSFTLKELCGLI
jgi:beta-lactamase class A